MGIYADHVLPRLMDVLLSARELEQIRRAVAMATKGLLPC